MRPIDRVKDIFKYTVATHPRMEKRNLQKILAESESIRKAVEQGIPLEEAVELYLEVNRLVEEGKWIELHVRKPKHAEKLEQGTSVIRYWGSKELLGEEGYISTSKAKSLYEKGLIGKTHELVRGSDYHPKERELDPSMPPP
ncbi:hypothetical protein HYS48_02865, partial [Candidatus Woesearchaeota archaeon]|nr:hypothetical protein [Candidatus Woesearchaeota archaeon]